MAQEEVSLWAEIKKHEDTLVKDPLSYCFAPLAELYRKVGLLDEAVDVARKGCGQHPDYVGGFMALGRAYFEKGLQIESRDALEKVIAVTPDNNLALKLLSQLYLDIGEYQLAGSTLRALLAINPDDVESRILLKSLARDEAYAAAPINDLPGNDSPGENQADKLFSSAIDFSAAEEIDGVEDLTEELFEDDGLFLEETIDTDEDIFATELPEEISPPVLVKSRQKDPLTTVTLAELYVSQGFFSSALNIYEELLSVDPDNQEYFVRRDELRLLQENSTTSSVSVAAGGFAAVEPVTITEPIFEDSVNQLALKSDEVSVTGELELWLNNIRRMRDVI